MKFEFESLDDLIKVEEMISDEKMQERIQLAIDLVSQEIFDAMKERLPRDYISGNEE
jgi:hypothetical protein